VAEATLMLTGSPPIGGDRARDDARLRTMLAEHFDFIWRSLRRFGLSADRADDAAQQVFLIASRRLAEIKEGSERSFLFGTALRVASEARRSASRRPEIAHADVPEAADTQPAPDELLDRHRARAVLDRVLEAIDMELRVVFILFELEEMSTIQIGELLEIPVGTASSRLRRAREAFEAVVKRMKARGELRGGAR